MQVLLADDHAIFREGLMLLIGTRFPQIEWYQANNWHEIHQVLLRSPITLALVDLNMPGQMPWPDEIRRLSKQVPKLPICILSATSDPEVIQSAFQLGIKGYIPKLVDIEELQQAISVVLSGRTYLPSQLWETQPTTNNYDKAILTQRQSTIMRLLAQGNSNKQIGITLNLTESTVKRHVYNIFQTLAVNNRVEAIRSARQRGLIT
jgi:DNA-binding NarL/FixJ family response regulator